MIELENIKGQNLLGESHETNIPTTNSTNAVT